MLINKFDITELTNLLGFNVFDTTYDYNATTNVGGYGDINPEIVDVVDDMIDITVPNNSSYTATGTVYNVVVFPTLPTINNGTYFTVLPSDIGQSDDISPIQDGLYQITRTTYYGLSDPIDFVTYTKTVMFTNNVKVLLAEYMARMASGGCSCCASQLPLAKEIQQDLQGIEDLMECELYNKAAYVLTDIYRKINKLNC